MKDKWEACAIYLGIGASLFTVWIMGKDIHPGLHKILILILKTSLLLLALTIHEWSHAGMALLFGDKTAKLEGRLSINPLSHFDYIGLIIVPGIFLALHSPIFIGWASPVPIDFNKMRNKRLGIIFTSLAGPLSNLFLAVFISSCLRMFHISGTENLFFSILWTFCIINFVLFVFNLLPLYPMDGGRVVLMFFPLSIQNWVEQHERLSSLISFFILVIIVFMLYFVFNVNILLLFNHIVNFIIQGITGSNNMDWFLKFSKWITI